MSDERESVLRAAIREMLADPGDPFSDCTPLIRSERDRDILREERALLNAQRAVG